MSIATEITRLQNAKADIKTSIENKGVTVGNAKLDGYSALIDSIQTGITPSGSISIVSNNTYDVTNYASAVVNVPNPSTGTLSISANGTYDVTNYASADVNVSGGVDLSWIASSTPTPNVRNLFYALSNGTAEHGEFTLANTPTSFIDVFTLTNLTEPQGIIFIDKDFYQTSQSLTGLADTGETLSLSWMDKSFTNPAVEALSESPIYVSFNVTVHKTQTNAGTIIKTSNVIFDGTTLSFRSYFQFSGKTFQIKSQYNNNNQFSYFARNRTYIWIAY